MPIFKSESINIVFSFPINFFFFFTKLCFQNEDENEEESQEENENESQEENQDENSSYAHAVDEVISI